MMLITVIVSAQSTTLDRIWQNGTLAFGLDPRNLPFSMEEGDRHGFDFEIAEKMAGHLDVHFKPYWSRFQHPSLPSRLLKKACDGLIGLPAESLADKKGIDFTAPYLGAGFVLAVRRGEKSVSDLADLKGKTVGIETGVLIQKLQGHVPREYPSQTAILTAVDKGEVPVGYVGSMQAGWLLKNHPEWRVELVKNFIPEDRWNLAIAVRKEDVELKAALNKVIQQMLDNGEIETILKKYGVPFYPPFK